MWKQRMDQGYFWEVSDKISNRIEGRKFINKYKIKLLSSIKAFCKTILQAM